MDMQMKALVYEGPKDMNMRMVSIPEPSADEVVVRVHTAGICGSELSGYLGKNSLRVPPLIMGHEFSGVVKQIGGRVSHFKKGDRVTANPLIFCNHCRHCLKGSHQLCAERRLIGAHQAGAYAEYVRVPERNLHSLPDHVTLEQGALAEPFACGIHMIRLSGITSVDKLLIIGAGPIGLFALKAAQLFGLQDVVITDLNPDRLAIAEEMGAVAVPTAEALKQSVSESGFDAAIDAVGLSTTRQQCMEAVAAGGKVIFSGLHTDTSELPVNSMIRQELLLYGVFGYTPVDFSLAVQWISEGKIEFSSWVEYMTMEEGKQGFEKLINNPGKIAKILLKI